jgi:hypothetical protein
VGDCVIARTCLRRLDARVGAVVHAEQHVVDALAVSGDVAGQVALIIREMGLDRGDEAMEQSARAPVMAPVRPGFTRRAGSIRRQVPAHEVRGPRSE